MKRVTIILLMMCLVISAAFSETRVLLDFSKLEENKITIGTKEHHEKTIIDFADLAENMDLTEEMLKEMMISMALNEWEIELTSSSQTVENMRYSFTQSVGSKKYLTVLGARIHFPTHNYNSWAMIKPPFEIPAYSTPTKIVNEELVELKQEEIDQYNQQNNLTPDNEGYMDLSSKFDGFGVLKNVEIIKSISINVYGTNYPHGLSIRIKDQNENIRDIFMGYLDFDGWKTLTWENPNYIEDVKDREMKKSPLYPFATPYIKLIGLIITRDGSNIGGDFVVYFKDILVTFDKAIITFERDIDNEDAWQILTEREEARRLAEQERVGDIQLLRYIEEQKKHKEEQIETTE